MGKCSDKTKQGPTIKGFLGFRRKVIVPGRGTWWAMNNCGIGNNRTKSPVQQNDSLYSAYERWEKLKNRGCEYDFNNIKIGEC